MTETANAIDLLWRERAVPDELMAPVLVAIRTSINLPALAVRLGYDLTPAGERYALACPFPSTTPGVNKTCGAEDATGGVQPQNLRLSVGVSGWFYYCHSCKRNGDAIDLLALAERRSWLSACRALARAAGVAHYLDGELKATERDEIDDELAEPYGVGSTVRTARSSASFVKGCAARVSLDTAITLNRLACSIWIPALRASAEALAYVHGRGITDEQIKRYGIGYAPKSNSLRPVLAQGYYIAARELGLLASVDGRHFDGFRERITFPYLVPAQDGRPAYVSGFAARLLTYPNPNPRLAKCRNSSNVPGVWEKSTALFGLAQALQLLGDGTRLAIVEGPFDVLACDRAGIPAVAPYGVAFSQSHAHVLRRYATRVCIIVDGDPAGICSALGTAANLCAAGFVLDDITAVYPGDGLDPDDMPVALLRGAWDAEQPVLDFLREHANAEMLAEGKARKAAVRFLGCLDPSTAATLAAAWNIVDTEQDIAAQRRDLAEALDNNAGQRFASLLLATPDCAVHLSASKIKELFNDAPEILRRLSGLSFGTDKSHNERAWPRDIVHGYYAAGLYMAERRLAAHRERGPATASRDDMRRWAIASETLQSECLVHRRMFESLTKRAD